MCCYFHINQSLSLSVSFLLNFEAVWPTLDVFQYKTDPQSGQLIALCSTAFKTSLGPLIECVIPVHLYDVQ